jgi:hypothetical protein
MVIFHSYVSLPEGTYEFKKKHSQFWRKWGPKHHQVEVDYWVHTIHGFGCQAFQHVLLLGVTATPLEKSEPPLEKFASAPCWHLHHAGCWLNRVPLGSPYYYPPIIWCHVTVISRVCICLDKILDCTVHKIHNTSGYIRSDMSLKSPLCKKKKITGHSPHFPFIQVTRTNPSNISFNHMWIWLMFSVHTKNYCMDILSPVQNPQTGTILMQPLPCRTGAKRSKKRTFKKNEKR